MIRFTFRTYPNATSDNSRLFNETLENVPAKFAVAVEGFPSTPGWDTCVFVSNLAQAFSYD